MNNQSGTSLLLPVLLAGAGVATLAAAIILVPSMARRYAESRPCPGAPAAESPVAAVAPKAPPTAEPPKAPPTAEPPKAPPTAEPPRAPAPAPPPGAWSIEMDPGDYALLGDGEASIDAIIAVLARDSKAVVSLTGVNSPNKSSKRAKRAAEIVKEKIVADVGITARQVETSAAQEPAVDGLIVRAEIVGGGR